MSSRRTVLAGTLSLLAGCNVAVSTRTPTVTPVDVPTETPAPGPDFALELAPLTATAVGESYLLDRAALSEHERDMLDLLFRSWQAVEDAFEPTFSPGSHATYLGRVYRIDVELLDERTVESPLVTLESDPDSAWQDATLAEAVFVADLTPVDREVFYQTLEAFPVGDGATVRWPLELPEEGESRLREGAELAVVHGGVGYRLRATGRAFRTERTFRYTAVQVAASLEAFGTDFLAERAVDLSDLPESDRQFLRAAMTERVQARRRTYHRLYSRVFSALPAGPGLPPAVALDGAYYAATLLLL
jgi:hypothetical protein